MTTLKQAPSQLLTSAEGGHPVAQMAMVRWELDAGRRLKAKEWLMRAIDNGNSHASAMLGQLYWSGDHAPEFPKNTAWALEFLWKAAFGLHGESAMFLARLYSAGDHSRGIQRNAMHLQTALDYAARSNSGFGQFLLGALYSGQTESPLPCYPEVAAMWLNVFLSQRPDSVLRSRAEGFLCKLPDAARQASTDETIVWKRRLKRLPLRHEDVTVGPRSDLIDKLLFVIT